MKPISKMFERSPRALGPIFHTILKTRFRDFPGGSVVLRLCSLSMQGWAGLIPGQGTNSPNALWHGQKLKKKKKKYKKTEVLTQKDAIKHRRDFCFFPVPKDKVMSSAVCLQGTCL